MIKFILTLVGAFGCALLYLGIFMTICAIACGDDFEQWIFPLVIPGFLIRKTAYHFLKPKIEKNEENNEEVKSLEMILKTVENINGNKNSELEKYKEEMQELKLKIENNEKARLAEHIEKIEKNKEKTTIKCPNCSALNTVIVGEVCYCEFCGTPLKQNK